MKHILLSLLLLPVLALASEAEITVKAPVDLSDHESLQRGAKTFVNYCLNCHSANYMRYNRLQDIGLSEKQIKDNLLFAGDKVGDTMKVAIDPQDAKKWFGAAPPDLSVEVRARGADWLYAYLRGFYKDDTRPTGWNNLVFDKVAMPHVLYELQGVQTLNHETHALEIVKPGKLSPAEYNAMVGDLTNYMAFMSEPAKQSRKYIGIVVLLFLGVMLVLAKKIKAEYWKDIK
ncbi:MAG: cytochrome c1 [Methylophilales bacterium 28-44-11]|jgi:ubiquinol-cytochrome c reductase cytochrome c1 subunit|nr:MAG: cytochrome c1 [Methylophilales bacterium 28-44-11]